MDYKINNYKDAMFVSITFFFTVAGLCILINGMLTLFGMKHNITVGAREFKDEVVKYGGAETVSETWNNWLENNH